MYTVCSMKERLYHYPLHARIQNLIDHGQAHFVLTFEVIIEGALGYSGGSQDIIQACGLVAFPVNQREGLFEDHMARSSGF